MNRRVQCVCVSFNALAIVAVAGCSPAPSTSENGESIATTATKLIGAEDCVLGSIDGKVGVCHVTGSTTSPYVHIRVSTKGCINGHARHPGDFVSDDSSCHLCVPTTCAAEGKTCDTIPDGCGGSLDCGTCVAPAVCGGDGVSNVCGYGNSGCTTVTCDDANPCTIDNCTAAGECTHTTAVGTSCSDGNACNGAETCDSAGSCVSGAPVVCIASDQCHDVGICDPGTGACSNTTKLDGAPCDDGNACTQADTCQAGACSGGNPLACGALDQCHDIGICDPATGQCSNPIKQDGTTCTGIPFVPLSNSCQGLTTLCQAESCCTSITVLGGNFPMGRSEVSTSSDFYSGGSTNELPEHNAIVATFALDKYEVTVERFRKFVDAYDVWHGTDDNPKDNAGVHPIALNTGWGRSWTASSSDLPAGSTELTSVLNCASGFQTWTDTAASNEGYAISCVSWQLAFAFCIWDGGRLPTEAEWEYAAAGGSLNRLYPWGSASPDATHANCHDTDHSPFIAVGSKGAMGAGYYGHQDLAGSMWEWVFDWDSSSYYGTSTTPSTCDNCANSEDSSYRVYRGGGWNGVSSDLRAAARHGASQDPRNSAIGFRCARTAQ